MKKFWDKLGDLIGRLLKQLKTITININVKGRF
jgi:hypothetical protein